MRATPTRAIVREVPESYADAVTTYESEQPISVSKAREQHRRYVELLRESGLAVHMLLKDDAYPDCVFVEDQAVVAAGHALMTRPGHPSRRGEAPAVEAALRPYIEIHRMQAPALLDGGDVLRIGRTLAVGVGARTNREGVEVLEATFAPLGFDIVPVPLTHGPLHLKSVCTGVTDDTVLLAADTVDVRLIESFADVIVIPEAESYGVNALQLPGRVLISEGFNTPKVELERRGVEAVSLETTEFQKADGALTCLSILL